MASPTFDALFRSLRGGALEPVYYLHGDEDILKDELLAAIVERALDPAMRDFNVDQPDAAGLDAERLTALLDTPPMLAERRVVVLRGVEQLRKKTRVRDTLLRYLERPNPATVLVLWQGAGEAPADDLAAGATAVAVERLPPERVHKWIAHRATTLGLAIEPAAATHLATSQEGDLGAIAGELDKLAAAVSGRAATRDDVERLTGVRHGETLADLVAAALERRVAAAARLVGPVLDQPGTSGVRAVTALGTALVGTALARAELDRGTPPGRADGVVFRHILAARPAGLGLWKEAAAQWVRWAQRWRAAELRRALRLTLAADRRLKESRISDEAPIVTELVLRWAVPEREAA
jgi:DNA polymerase-3 subunit delta